MATPARTQNRLAKETSPYLLQHADNPVDWYPWGDPAFARARTESKPVMLSIGYSACHWCHVMEHESFADEAVAAFLNAHFVAVKVDREERPDLDEIYMAATIAMTGHGGWPMTVFLLPDQRPFFAGTYFPRESRHGRPGFLDLLERIREVWEADREGAESQAEKLTQALRARVSASAEEALAQGLPRAALHELHGRFDAVHGGFGTAPKFPPCPQLHFLIGLLSQRDGDAAVASEIVHGTLRAMARGGMHDHLGGGFARYSTDERWQVPHFEKMLYDNAQLARVYTEAHAATGDADYAEVARETLRYLVADMCSPEGAFYSATDADSEGVEGKYFTFEKDELSAALSPEEARAACAYFDVRAEGNWEHTNVLWTPRTASEVALGLGISEAELAAHVAGAKAKLLALRSTRVPPARDEKIIAAWNGLTISALARGGAVLQESGLIVAAARAAAYVLTCFTRPDGGLFRTARAGRAQFDGYLEDYAFLGSALLDLYEATADRAWLSRARGLAQRMVADFFDPAQGTFFQTAHGHEPLIARPREAHDGALPNPAASAAALCARLGMGAHDAALLDVARRATAAFGGMVGRAPSAFCSLLVAAALSRGTAPCIALVGPQDAPAFEALRSVVLRLPQPGQVLIYGDGQDTRGEALLEARPMHGGLPTAYVCIGETCLAPSQSVEALQAQLNQSGGSLYGGG
jgi:uncharacterized protein YyaL (SSP411 family)